MNAYIKYFLVALLANVLFSSCDDTNNHWGGQPSLNFHYLYVGVSTVNLAASDTEQTITVSAADATPWRFEGYDASWLTFTPSSGIGEAAVTVVASANPMAEKRSTKVTLVSTDPEYEYSKYIEFTQEEGYIKADKTVVKFGANTSEESVGISSNLNNIVWKATSNSSWLSATPSDDGKSLIISTSENHEGIRVGKVYISSADDKISSTIPIVQEAYSYYEQIGPCRNENHPHTIDMGDGLKWSCCNVGAKSPIEYGDYFAWGETKTKTTYDWSTYKYCKGTEETLTKYCGNSEYGTVDNKTQLEMSDDAARSNWGGTWRMPTVDEMEKLSNNCIWVWTSINKVNGYLVISPFDNLLFFPAAGEYWDFSSGYWGNGYIGYYWTSSTHDYYPVIADALKFESNRKEVSIVSRCYGLSVRPVKE